MSTSARICTALFSSAALTAAWEVAAFAGAHATGDAQPSEWVMAAGLFPQVAAVAVLLVIEAADRPTEREETPATVPVPRREAVGQPRRRELAG